MKRTVLAMVTFIFLLTGCAGAETYEENAPALTETIKTTVSADNTQTPSVEPESGTMANITHTDDTQISEEQGGEGAALPLDFEALTAPPALTVSTLNNADSVSASCGNYHWSRTLPDGTITELTACGAHPLDWQEHPILRTAFFAKTLPPVEEGTDIGAEVFALYLDFGGILPQTVSAIRWPVSYIGDAQSHSTDFEEVTVEVKRDMITLVPLDDGDHVYEISAAWGEAGGASYTFRTQKDEMTGIIDALNELEYQPYTCDGLPEYRLTAADGTVYDINFSEKWVWRGKNEQAGLSDEWLTRLKENMGIN